jgi:hypothetical protein
MARAEVERGYLVVERGGEGLGGEFFTDRKDAVAAAEKELTQGGQYYSGGRPIYVLKATRVRRVES